MPDSSTHLRQFRRFAQYNEWFNGRIYEVAAELTDGERRRDVGAFFRSIHGSLNHILLTDRVWLARFAQHGRGSRALSSTPLVHGSHSLDQILYEDFGELAEQRFETDSAIRSWVDELSAELLDTDLHYVRTNGQPMVAPFWHAIAHLFNHQTHHRGQVTTLLHQLGHDPGVTDFMVCAFMPEGGA